jgi:iron complex transport system substrate-binding protein
VRIVSLLPSATEIVCVLGLENQLVGVTHECDFPPMVRGLPKVTRTLIPDASSGEIDRLVREQLKTHNALYTLDYATLEALQPDVIVTQALCDVCAVAEEEVRAAACQLPGSPRVINMEPRTITEVMTSIQDLGATLGLGGIAQEVVAQLNARIERVAVRSRSLRQHPTVALLEWLDPPFSCGHWTPELVRLASGIELLGREGQPSRTLRWEDVIASQPEVVFIACCGFSVERTKRDLELLQSVPGWRELPAVRSKNVFVVDGSQYFSRPGPRLVDSLEMLAHALHPQAHPLPPGLPSPVRTM